MQEGLSKCLVRRNNETVELLGTAGQEHKLLGDVCRREVIDVGGPLVPVFV